MKKLILFFTVVIVYSNLYRMYGQNAPFNILLTPYSVTGLPGIQSYAIGKHNGKWLIVGGRLDGLHRRQPFAAFDVAGHNTDLVVVDPGAGLHWALPMTSLPVSIQEQLNSTNMEFYQQDSFLYCIGGYGYSNTMADHITYDKLTAINVPLVIDAVINGSPVTAFFRQITDSQFAVTGGRLDKIYNTWYLVGGQKFDGRYNPMNMPTFTQEYTNQIRKFLINDNGSAITITHFPAITDTNQLHRRDYNVIPQIMPNGEEGLTAFSGVFQSIADIPYLNAVNIDSTGFLINSSFSQYYNHYHCATIPLYSDSSGEMHNVFFGGIAQYYDSMNVLVQDNNVPFVKTIARVTRDINGTMTEYKLPSEMPSLLGAGSEFISVEGLSEYNNHVLKLDSLTADTTWIGYIFGGISSTAPNIFFTNNGTQSSATNQLFKVFLVRNSLVGIHQPNEQSRSSLQMQVYPNPNNGEIRVKFNLLKKSGIKLSVRDMSGKIIIRKNLSQFEPGVHIISYRIENYADGGTYIVKLETAFDSSTQKIIINTE